MDKEDTVSVCVCHTHRHTMEYCAALSHYSHVQPFVALWTIAHQAPLSMGFTRQEY